MCLHIEEANFLNKVHEWIVIYWISTVVTWFWHQTKLKIQYLAVFRSELLSAWYEKMLRCVLVHTTRELATCRCQSLWNEIVSGKMWCHKVKSWNKAILTASQCGSFRFPHMTRRENVENSIITMWSSGKFECTWYNRIRNVYTAHAKRHQLDDFSFSITVFRIIYEVINLSKQIRFVSFYILEASSWTHVRSKKRTREFSLNLRPKSHYANSINYDLKHFSYLAVT